MFGIQYLCKVRYGICWIHAYPYTHCNNPNITYAPQKITTAFNWPVNLRGIYFMILPCHIKLVKPFKINVHVTLKLSAPYAVLPLFATRIASCTHGHSSLLHRRMSLLNRYQMVCMSIYHLFGWNLRICFPCICHLGCPGIFNEDSLGFEIEHYCLYVCFTDAPEL